jgi:probable HAF family extracellular repeat protein
MRSVVLTAAACVLFVPAVRAAPFTAHGVGRQAGPGRAQVRAPMAPPTMPAPNFSFIDFPGTSVTGAYDLNLGAAPHAKSLVVGSYGPGALSDTGNYYGFLLRLGTKNSVESEAYQTVLPAMNSIYANGINDAGVIVGSFNNNSEGFLLSKGVMTVINVPYQGAAGTNVEGINDSRVVVGSWYTAGGAASHLFTWHHGVFTQVPDYPGGSQQYPGGINNNGDISGIVTDSNGVNHAFLLKNGVYTLIDPPGSAYTAGGGVNDADEIVGLYCTTVQDCSQNSENTHGFLYSNGTYTTIDYPNAPFTTVTSINDQGMMVGFYVDQGGYGHSFLINP